MERKKVKINAEDEKIAIYALAAGKSLIESFEEVGLKDLDSQTTAIGLAMVDVIEVLSRHHNIPDIFLASVINTLINHVLVDEKETVDELA